MFTIGLSGVFSLARWCWQIQTEFHRLRPTQDTNHIRLYTCTGLSPSMVQLSRCLPLHTLIIMSVLQPHCSLNCSGLGCSAFARHYLRNHCCFLFLRLLRCSVHRVSLLTSQHTTPSTWWVFPFGHLRITSYLPIPAAYRSLSRPSSPLRAKASSIRSSLFSSVFQNILLLEFL